MGAGGRGEAESQMRGRERKAGGGVGEGEAEIGGEEGGGGEVVRGNYPWFWRSSDQGLHLRSDVFGYQLVQQIDNEGKVLIDQCKRILLYR